MEKKIQIVYNKVKMWILNNQQILMYENIILNDMSFKILRSIILFKQQNRRINLKNKWRKRSKNRINLRNSLIKKLKNGWNNLTYGNIQGFIKAQKDKRW